MSFRIKTKARAQCASVCLALAVSGCSGAVDLDLDPRKRPCTAVAGPASAVRWFSPAVPEQRRRLDAWCAAVGTPVVQQPVVAETLAPVQRLVVVSWNVHVGGGDIAALTSDLRSGRLTGGDPLPFVLLLQEAFRVNGDVPAWQRGHPAPARIAPTPPSGRRLSTPDLGSRLGLHLVYVPSMRNGEGRRHDREDRGSAILSTMPLLDPQAIELPFERQRRVAVAARLAALADNTDLWLLNVHLENRTGPRRGFLESPTARARQARALVRKFLPDGPAVLGGDLNTWAPNEPTLDLLKDVFDTPVDSDTRDTLPGIGRIDYLLARLPADWTMTTRRLDSQYGSDHYPVLGVVTLPAPTPP